MTKKEILLIGTVHVFDLSNELVALFDKEKPDVICVEFDETRYRSAITGKRKIKKVPFFLKQLFKIEKGLAKKYRVIPAADMIIAIYYAQAHNIPLEFIDMDVNKIIDRCNKAPVLDKILLSFGFTMARILLLFSGKRGFEFLYKSSNKNSRGPTPFFDSFIAKERNEFMADRLKELSGKYRKIVACVGDRHIFGISELLGSCNIKNRKLKINDLKKIGRG